MTLAVSRRRFVLATHVITSVGWLGAVAVFLVHAIASLLSQDEQMVRALSLAMGLTAWFVILPLSVAALATGILQAIGTAWGLIRHYWIVFKLLLTVAATAVLLLKLGPIGHVAQTATEPVFSATDLIGARTSIAVHAGGGLVVLILATLLGIYKPQGLTPYGVRKLGPDHGRGVAVDTPPWVRVFVGIVAVLVAMVALMLFSGDHGPSVHLQ